MRGRAVPLGLLAKAEKAAFLRAGCYGARHSEPEARAPSRVSLWDEMRVWDPGD